MSEHPAGRVTRLKKRSAKLARRARELPEQVPLVGRALGHLLRVNLLDCATRLAAQAFLSALPALFVVAVFTPAAVRENVMRSLRKELGLEGAAQQSVQQMLQSSHDQETTIGVFGALVTLASATALSRAMQRVCERCWELPRAGSRVVAWRWLVWLLVWLVCLMFQTPLRDGFGLGAWLGIPLTFVGGTAIWWWTQHLLLVGRVRWLPLLPGALLCGAVVVGLGIASRIYLPRAMAHSVTQFGPYGVVFTGLSWLIVMFAGLTLAIALGRVVSEEEAVAHWLGTRTEPGVWGGAPLTAEEAGETAGDAGGPDPDGADGPRGG
ncbi:YihY/virulence factor BrkB family protein [Kitasatospora sp. NBC_01246]|uniref:YhjD/YihY/BrkB family envelope integrity protein n=1 Tax=Kitasatospora sp. NBC_01246 TaxID=2903570 RepID=UPI002E3597A5|nr:YhjD/YihY/BrkB family envelope integrity protein [Kitasatospora sp. NBC_01246]